MKKTIKILETLGICAVIASCNIHSVPEPIAAEGFAKGDRIIAADFHTNARIVKVYKRSGAKYNDKIVSTQYLNGDTASVDYQENGKFDVDLTSGIDDATGLPIIRYIPHLTGSVTLTHDYNKKSTDYNLNK